MQSKSQIPRSRQLIIKLSKPPLTKFRIFPRNLEPDFTHYLSGSEITRKEHPEMKKQNKLNIKIRDLEPLKDVTAGRRRHRSHAEAFNDLRGEYRGGLGPFGLRRIQ